MIDHLRSTKRLSVFLTTSGLLCGLVLGLATGVPEICSSTAGAQEASEAPAKASGPDLTSQLKAASKQVAGEQTFLLQYRPEKGQTIRWKVVHLVTVDTKIRGSEQTAKTRSVSQKAWRVTDVDAEGNVTVVLTIEHVDMWQSLSGRQEVRYNSRTDAVPPREYEAVAKSIGVPLATVTFNRHGRVLKRDSSQPQFNAGLGELTIPLPEQPVKLGAKWNVPEEVSVRLEDGRVQRIKTRLLYSLDKVETGVATIGVKTEILTPVSDPKVHSQIVQRMTNGSLKFDLEAGRLLSKQVDLDETVVGFSGADSVMQYLARLTEDVQSVGDTEPAGEAAGKVVGEAAAGAAVEAAAKPEATTVPR